MQRKQWLWKQKCLPSDLVLVSLEKVSALKLFIEALFVAVNARNNLNT